MTIAAAPYASCQGGRLPHAGARIGPRVQVTLGKVLAEGVVLLVTDDDLWLADQPDAVRPHRVVQAILPLSLANHGPIGVDELSPVNNVVAG